MNRRRRVYVLIGSLAGLLCLSAASPADEAAAGSRFEQDARALASGRHRLGGTPEYAEAADFVVSRLQEIGLDEVFVQTFAAAQAMESRCELVAPDGRAYALTSGRPNGIMAPVTPPEGITGELVYVGKGTPADFERADPRGKIAVLEYNSGESFVQAFRLGAVALVVVSEEPARAWNHHYVRANANLPRFFFDGSPDELPLGERVTLYSTVNWQRVNGRNVVGYLKGTDPVFNFQTNEVVILAAQLDSFGEFPRVSPGGRGAANCAVLLKIAEQFKALPPKRDTVFLFMDMNARAHAGAAAFYTALEDTDRHTMVEYRERYWREETDFLKSLITLIGGADPLSEGAPEHRRELLRRLRSISADKAFLVRAELMDMREEHEAMRRGEREASEEEMEALAARIEQWDVARERWNDLRRGLGRGVLDPTVKDLFDETLVAVRESAMRRQEELEHDEQIIESAERIKNLLGGKWINLHATLLLGDTTRRWGVLIGGDSEIRSNVDVPGLYGRIKTSFETAYRAWQDAGRTPGMFYPVSVGDLLPATRLLWSAPMLVHSGEIAGRFGFFNIVLGSMQERLPREGTPDDTIEALDLGLIEAFADEIIMMLGGIADGQRVVESGLADQPGLSMRHFRDNKQYISSYFDGTRPQGALCMGRQRGSSMPNMPVPGATVQISVQLPWNRGFWPYSKAYAFDQFSVVMSDQNGAYNAGPLPEGEGSVYGFVAAFDGQGLPVMASDNESVQQVLKRLNMFNSVNGFLMLPPGFWPNEAQVMNSRANAVISDDSNERAYTETTDGVVLFFCDDKVPGVKAFGLKSIAALGLDPDDDLSLRDSTFGSGFLFPMHGAALLTARQSAWDIWLLNESRLDIMRRRDIMNSSLEELHGRIRDALDEAELSSSPAEREAVAAGSFLAAQPIYEMIRTSMDDLVTAVLILLALCVPFAFALERLLIGASIIYKQVSWFALFFILTFVVLYLSHPAFAIAQTPIIIFLGFAVVVLSVLVIAIIMQKFQIELKTLQGMTASVHTSDISRFNTIMAAMSMGISTMRRRPLRTALTAITIILLTFTILCFASFDTQKGIIRLFTAPSPPYTGVFMRNSTYGSYNPDFLDIVRARWGDAAIVTPRFWVCPEFENDPDFVVAHENGDNPVTLRGILGLSPTELEQRADLRELLGLDEAGDIEQFVFITSAVAELMSAKPGDVVMVRGLPLTLGPLLRAADLSVARDMDGSSVLPVDFLAMKKAQADQRSTSDVTEEQDKWSSLPVDSIVIMSARNCRLAYGKCHAIPIYTQDSQQSEEIAEDIARMMDKTPIIATRRDGVYRHILGTTVAASGVNDLLFPIILGGLVIFGTMLGSVADREKEIYTFSALGLAPPHVASLFFAEAMVYSVIGGLGGYLIAQGSMKILGFLASFGLVQVPEMNYSSTNAIATILIVMATVLISAIYPAIKASKSANPGLLRSWKLPEPEGNVIDLVFPFTVSEYDLTGVVSFLKEHFDTFSDTGLGAFMARDAQLIIAANGSLGISTRLAIAPFDLGVTEAMELKSAPSEIPGIDEVNIRLTRLSGQPRDWVRLNKVLLDDLRTQFLLWRSLPAASMEHYRQRTLAEMAEQKKRAKAPAQESKAAG